jgi:hypothetical protein
MVPSSGFGIGLEKRLMKCERAQEQVTKQAPKQFGQKRRQSTLKKLEKT